MIETETREKGGAPLFTNRSSIFVRGEGGFGGDSGPEAGQRRARRARPTWWSSRRRSPQQALLYRLYGDKNPLHVDPEFAKMGGFDIADPARPVLVRDRLQGGGRPRARRRRRPTSPRYEARFAGVVFPGETIVTSMWREDGKILLSAKTAERGSPVLGNAAITLR